MLLPSKSQVGRRVHSRLYHRDEVVVAVRQPGRQRNFVRLYDYWCQSLTDDVCIEKILTNWRQSSPKAFWHLDQNGCARVAASQIEKDTLNPRRR